MASGSRTQGDRVAEEKSVAFNASPSRRSHLFPNFKPLEMNDRAEIEAFTRRFDPYSDFCFSLLTFYNCGEHTSWCWLNENLVLRFSDSFGPGVFLTFLGTHRVAATADVLINYAVEMGFTPVLWRIPEVTAKALAQESEAFFIEEDRDGFDYVYALDSLARMDGPAFCALRRDLNQIKRRHSPHEFVELDLRDATTRRDLQSVMTLWNAHKQAEGTVENYHRALDNCLRHAGAFDLIGLGAIVGDSLAGFTLAEQIGNGWMLSHFAVAAPRLSGVSGSLLHQLALAGVNLGFANLNYQEDVGDPGLRRFKMKCVPGFLRKFSVSRATREGEAPPEPIIVGSHGGSPSRTN